jgi:hypothetical protein
MSLDSEFVKPKVLSIYGNRDNGLDRSSGWAGEGGATTKTNYHPYNRARLHIYSGSAGLAMWFRGQSELKLAGLWLTFDFESKPQQNHLITLSKAIVHWTNVSCESINKSGGGQPAVMKVTENCNCYMMGGGKSYFGGLTGHSFMYVDGFSTGGVGMPGSWTHVTTEVGGTFKKRKYKTHSAATFYHGRGLDNSTGNWDSLSETMQGSNGASTF